MIRPFRAGFVMLSFALLVVASAAAAGLDTGALDGKIKAILNEHGDGVVAGIWLGGATGPATYTWKADAAQPTASAIKTAFLVELFAKYADSLDEPPPGLDEILADAHPAVAHFSPEQRTEIRKELGGASVRKIGRVMTGSAPASNVVYNAAANVVTALLGGPDGLTKAIHDRDPTFVPIVVRRYMLADRKAHGDNEATAESLAAVLKRLASDKIPRVSQSTLVAIRDAMLSKELRGKGLHHYKEGSLDSDPLVRVRSGWVDGADGKVVYVVMLTQPNPGDRPRAEAGQRLAKTAEKVTDSLLEAAFPTK